ncbi:aminotransferase class III-fold pyridoxal phosphate-dependent enzyme, partial [bacterium]|nr:aminotransferase class III-fold pyridoxal phosphate-dependent enzyme [bacterium]
FKRIKAKIKGFMEQPQKVLRDFPSTDTSIAARYGRSIALYRLGRTAEALAIIDGLLKEIPNDPHFLELKGQIYFETGKVKDAVVCYRASVKQRPHAPTLNILLAHSLIESSPIRNPEELEEAIRALKLTLDKDPENVFAWRLLAGAYGKNGQTDFSAGALAAIIVEPMQGTNGNIIPPNDYLPALKEVAKEFNALLIVDEMITGFGRTGKYWGSHHSGVAPDIVTLGKQFGGGYPVAALMSSEKIVNTPPWSNPSGSSSSYGGNPLGSAAANAALKIIEEEGLVENSRRVGDYFLSKLKQFEEKHSFIGQVRGAGLFLAIEMVKDKETKEPLPKKICQQIFMEHLKRGLLTMSYAPSFRIQPSMTIDEGTVDHSVAIMEEVFNWVEKERLWEKV